MADSKVFEDNAAESNTQVWHFLLVYTVCTTINGCVDAHGAAYNGVATAILHIVKQVWCTPSLGYSHVKRYLG